MGATTGPGTRAPFARFGALVRAAREQAGLSQEELGRVLGVDHATVSKYEHGRIHPSVEAVNRLSQALGLDPIELLRALGYELPAWTLDASQLDDRALELVRGLIHLARQRGAPPPPARSAPAADRPEGRT